MSKKLNMKHSIKKK